MEEKAAAAQQVAAARVADLAKAAASGVPVLADPGQRVVPSPASAALADIAARLEKLHRGATMHLRLNRIAHGARLLGLRPVSLPHGMLKVRREASCCWAPLRSQGLRGRACTDRASGGRFGLPHGATWTMASASNHGSVGACVLLASSRCLTQLTLHSLHEAGLHLPCRRTMIAARTHAACRPSARHSAFLCARRMACRHPSRPALRALRHQVAFRACCWRACANAMTRCPMSARRSTTWRLSSAAQRVSRSRCANSVHGLTFQHGAGRNHPPCAGCVRTAFRPPEAALRAPITLYDVGWSGQTFSSADARAVSVLQLLKLTSVPDAVAAAGATQSSSAPSAQHRQHPSHQHPAKRKREPDDDEQPASSAPLSERASAAAAAVAAAEQDVPADSNAASTSQAAGAQYSGVDTAELATVAPWARRRFVWETLQLQLQVCCSQCDVVEPSPCPDLTCNIDTQHACDQHDPSVRVCRAAKTLRSD